MHGKVTKIRNNQTGLFKGLPKTYPVTRYHSLIVSGYDFPKCLKIDALSEDGVIMALHHKDFLFTGYSFIPKQSLPNTVMNC